MPRPPKPSALKVLQGTARPDRVNPNEPQPTRRVPPCPAWLDVEAKREWRRIAPELDRLGLLTVVDGAALAIYCQSYARWAQAERNGEYSLAKSYAALIRGFLTEFGLTPASRTRLGSPGASAAPADPMQALLD